MSSSSRTTKQIVLDERGEISSTVIFVATVLMSVMLVVQFGLTYHMRNVMSGAAQDGAAAAARVGSEPGQGADVAQLLLDEAAPTLLQSYVVSSERQGDRVVVAVHGSVVSLIPGFGPFDVSATASAPVEEFFSQGDS